MRTSESLHAPGISSGPTSVKSATSASLVGPSQTVLVPSESTEAEFVSNACETGVGE